MAVEPSPQQLTGASAMQAITVLAFITCLALAACHRGPVLPPASVGTVSPYPTQDHLKMASIYVRQAMRSRELAEEHTNRAFVYERVFGANSDWVSSARLLAQFYENSAQEQERQANWHLEMAGQRTESRQDTP
jgi:hypothetical protein